MTATERRLAGVLAIAVAVVASAVVAPVVAAGTAGAGTPADAAAASASTELRPGAWNVHHSLLDSTACSTSLGVVDATTNATTVGASVGLTDDTQSVVGAAAATVDGGTASDERSATTQPPRLTRRTIAPRTICPTR